MFPEDLENEAELLAQKQQNRRDKKFMKKKTTLEKRQFPRIMAKLPIRVTPQFFGESVDLSETGLGFVLDKPLPLSKFQAKIEISPKETIETNFKVIWNKQLVEQKKFMYGVCFIRFTKKDLDTLRHLLISQKVEKIIDKIKNKNEKRKISDFWFIRFKKYMTDIFKLFQQVSDNKMDDEGVIVERLTALNNNLLQSADKLAKKMESSTIEKKMKNAFRFFIGHWAFKSQILRRGYEKPLGYPGDYKMLELIYDNKSISDGIGGYFDYYFLNNPYAEAVRCRKLEMERILVQRINESKKDSLNILNLACGSCRELKEIYAMRKITYNGRITFRLVDQEEDALRFSEQSLGKFVNDKTRFLYFKENILKFHSDKSKYTNLFGKQDIIYSIGLVDYLPDRVLTKILNFCLDILDEDGELIITFKDKEKDPFAPLPPDWFCDWKFVPRTEKDAFNLLYGLKDSLSIHAYYEGTKRVVFFEIQKQKSK